MRIHDVAAIWEYCALSHTLWKSSVLMTCSHCYYVAVAVAERKHLNDVIADPPDSINQKTSRSPVRSFMQKIVCHQSIGASLILINMLVMQLKAFWDTMCEYNWVFCREERLGQTLCSIIHNQFISKTELQSRFKTHWAKHLDCSSGIDTKTLPKDQYQHHIAFWNKLNFNRIHSKKYLGNSFTISVHKRLPFIYGCKLHYGNLFCQILM